MDTVITFEDLLRGECIFNATLSVEMNKLAEKLIEMHTKSLQSELKEAEAHNKRLLDFTNKQAEDEGLWFQAETAPEAYLQAGLRKLHAFIEGKPTGGNDVQKWN